MGSYVHMNVYAYRSQQRASDPGGEVTGGCEQPGMRCWEPNSASLQEQHMFIISESSF